MKTTKSAKARNRFRRGGSLVETAFVLSILVMLSFGAVEYAYFFFVKNMLVGAAREGARAAIPSGATDADVILAVSNVMTAAHIPATSYTLTIAPTDVSAASVVPGTPITITVACAWGTVGVTPLPPSMGGIATTKQVQGVAVMRKEQ